MSRLTFLLQSRTARGFTMIELMVVVAILAILATFAAPTFSRLIATNRIANHTNEFTGGLKLARAEAIRRGQPVTMRASSTTDAGDFAQGGWEVFPDQNGNGAPASATSTSDGMPIRKSPASDASAVVRRVDRTASGGGFTSAATALNDDAKRIVVFNSRGGSANNADAFFRVCDRANPSVNGRVVRVSVIGAVSMVDRQTPCTTAD